MWAARGSQKGWLDAVETDFHWLCSAEATLKDATLGVRCTLTEWVPMVMSNPSYWRTRIKKIAGLPAANIMNNIDDGGGCAILTDFLECEMCGLVLPSLQQLKLHEFKHHGVICLARQCVGPLNSCPTCLRRYPTRTQAIVHLRNAKVCTTYGLYADKFPEDLVTEMDAAEDERLAAKAAVGKFDCAAASHLPNVAGPLCKDFITAFKTRPRIDEVKRVPISLHELITA